MDSIQNADLKEKWWVKWLPWIALLTVLSLWIGNGLFLFRNADRGSYGDMFGVVNALFSGLAFAGVIYAVLLQKRELELQRKELELTRDELKGQRMQLTLQNQTLRKQNFEDTFFQLLRLHNDIVNAIDLKSGTSITKGRDCFSLSSPDLKLHTPSVLTPTLIGRNPRRSMSLSRPFSGVIRTMSATILELFTTW